jgi:hypothetical protein
MMGSTLACSPSQPPVVSTVTPSQGVLPLQAFCLVSLPQAWQREFGRGTIANVPDESIVPFAVSPSSDSVFVTDFSPRWHGIARVDAVTNRHVRIRSLPSTDQVLTGAFDGRWLVWTELHSLTTYFDWTLYAWDSQTLRVVQLASAGREKGQLITGPVAWPAIEDGVVGWSQAVSSTTSKLHLYSMTTHTDHVVAVGAVSDPVFLGSWVVWDYLDATRQHSQFAFANVDTGQLTSVPAALSSVRDPTMLAGSADTLAWAASGLQQLYVWRAPWLAPIRVLTVTKGDFAEYPAIAGNVVTFDGASAAFAADLRSSSITQITPQAGAIVGKGNTLAFNYLAPNTAKSLHPLQRVFVADVQQLPSLPHTGSSCV